MEVDSRWKGHRDGQNRGHDVGQDYGGSEWRSKAVYTYIKSSGIHPIEFVAAAAQDSDAEDAE